MFVEGTLLCGRRFDPVEGRIIIEDGEIVTIEEVAVESTDIVLPAFINAHTHLGDSIAKEAGAGLSLDALVAPPDGLKHRLLDSATQDEIVAAMRRSLRLMTASGTAACIEFREGGVDGVEAIRKAGSDLPIETVVLGRESEAAMHTADGFGASGARDGEFEQIRSATRDANKLFGIHAGERDADDITPAFNLDPDFLVHMVYPNTDHLTRLATEQIPTVVCPRSNLVTGVGVPPISDLAERTTLALGTDNAMLNAPSMFREMAYTAKLTDISARRILEMATINGAEIANLDYGVIEPGRKAKLLVLDGASDNLAGAQDIVRAVVRRADRADISDVIL